MKDKMFRGAVNKLEAELEENSSKINNWLNDVDASEK